MKSILILLTLVSLSFAASKVAIIDISGMTCPLCTSAIKKSLKHTKGIQKAKVLLNTRQATVIFDDTIASEKELLGAIKKAGYDGKIKSIKER
ncbi:heavy-metal-associated domain-containing protein [Sulfurospirillum sp. 1612]|uniref:heavy-metal-associated domain-containing protein n=1 Tax=Sulfurospirillum sp. 1612 TaxID=3094835 RepID=UPI002F928CB9